MRKATLFITAFIIFLFIGLGCKKDEDNPANPTEIPTVTGWWRGKIEIVDVVKYDINIRLEEVEKAIGSKGGIVTETLDGPGVDQDILACWGEHKYPSVKFEFLDYKFEGTMAADGNKMTGKLEIPNPDGVGENIKVDIIFNRTE